MAGPTGVNARTSDGVFPSLGSIQSASYLKVGSVVKNYQDKLDYFISETDEGSNIQISGTTPQLYANPEVTIPGTGETNTASNIGDGDGLFAQKVASDLQFYSQRSDFGLECNLIDNTYHQGLNPFIADNIGSFSGAMRFSRASTELGVNRSGVIEEVGADLPFYGKDGLSCYESYINLILKNQELKDSYWSKNNTLVTSSLIPDPSLGNGFFEVENTSTSFGFIFKNTAVPATELIASSSCYFKDVDSGFCGVRIALLGGTPIFGSVTYNFETGELSSSGSVSGYVEKLNNGIVRVFCYARNDGTNTNFDFRFYPCDPSGANAVSPGDSVLMWLPCGTYQSSFYYPPIKTDSSQVAVAGSSVAIKGIGNLPCQNGDFMFSFVVAIPDDNTTRDIFISNTGSSEIFLRKRGDSGKLQFVISDTSTQTSLSSDIDTQLHRVIVSYRSGELKLFIDGLVSDAASGVKYVTDASEDILIGDMLNSEIKIEKWLIGSSYTDQQIQDLGGPENAII